MVMPNAERVGQALNALRDGLAPRCAEAWAGHFGEGWAETVHMRDEHAVGEPSPTDLAWLLKGIHNTWNDLWRHRFGRNERSYSSELRDGRNRWAHQDAFSSDDSYRLLDTAERFLIAFGAAEEAHVVKALRQSLLHQTSDQASRNQRRMQAANPTEGEPLAGLMAWRELIAPHPDVATGQFEQAEFAADLSQVARGEADSAYQDPVAFFGRTYLTNGLRKMLIGAARRLSGDGGDPVIDLQTNFGGGKTHSMIALYHLASGLGAATMPGIGELLADEGVELPHHIQRAVLACQWLQPAQASKKPDGTVVHTLWGEIAWQLAGPKGYELVAAADQSGTNPGEALIELFRVAGPSVVLIDEWVAYARQLPSGGDSARMAGGDFDTQFTFAQALTEAARAVENVVVLVSIPISDIEVGGDKGTDALTRLSHVVQRVSAPWRPADDDESFEIVRRRLFEPLTPAQVKQRDQVIGAFWDSYRAKPTEFPTEVQENDYRRRMELAYPIHPELFDRLYADWSTLDRFQRTRGVLRLMANVISVLWQRGDKNLLIMPGTLPIDDPAVKSALTQHLERGWDPIIGTDVDGPNALPIRIDADARLGRYSATRRVARSVFFATAPRAESRGIDIKHLLVATAQPGEAPGIFGDALRKLSADATYLYVDGAQYRYALRANVTRLAADRANSNFTDENADDEIKRRLQSKQSPGPFAAVHAFPEGPGDVSDDDDGVHLVVLPLTAHHLPNVEETPAIMMAEQILQQRNAGPRLNRNLLVFCGASEARLAELRTAARQHLAWKSILDDANTEKIELTKADTAQARSRLRETDQTVDHRILETYQHVLVPDQTPGAREIRWHQTKPSGTGSLAERAAKKLESEERLITTYGGTRVRMDLDRIPLWSDQFDISVGELWNAYSRYPYLPRLANFEVLARAISDGASKIAWQTETFAYAEARDGDRWVGLTFASHVDTRPGGLLVHPNEAQAQIDAMRPEASTAAGVAPNAEPQPGGKVDHPKGVAKPGAPEPRTYYGQFKLDPVRAGRQLSDILPNIVDQLANAPGADVTITLEINAASEGYDEKVRRIVTENGNQLGVKSQEFE